MKQKLRLILQALLRLLFVLTYFQLFYEFKGENSFFFAIDIHQKICIGDLTSIFVKKNTCIDVMKNTIIHA